MGPVTAVHLYGLSHLGRDPDTAVLCMGSPGCVKLCWGFGHGGLYYGGPHV